MRLCHLLAAVSTNPVCSGPLPPLPPPLLYTERVGSPQAEEASWKQTVVFPPGINSELVSVNVCVCFFSFSFPLK